MASDVHICSGAEMPSTASPFFSTCPRRDDQREPARAHRGIVDQEPLRIIVTVEFLRQILEIERDLMRRQIARGVGELLGKVGEPAQERLLVRARQRRRGRPRACAAAPRRSRCPPAAAPSTRARARTARSTPGCRRTASARGRCRTRTRCPPCARRGRSAPRRGRPRRSGRAASRSSPARLLIFTSSPPRITVTILCST